MINIKLVSLKSDVKNLCKYIKSDSQLLIYKITLDYLLNVLIFENLYLTTYYTVLVLEIKAWNLASALSLWFSLIRYMYGLYCLSLKIWLDLPNVSITWMKVPKMCMLLCVVLLKNKHSFCNLLCFDLSLEQVRICFTHCQKYNFLKSVLLIQLNMEWGWQEQWFSH